jgi:DNA-directed RNA polymerase specialized sigma24 family protein
VGLEQLTGTPTAASASAFEAFFVRVDQSLRAALTARDGPDLGRDATAEALAWAFEHWDRAQALEQPVGYLYRVAQSRSRRLLRRERPLAGRAFEHTPDVDPRLTRALTELSARQRVAVLLVHGYDWTHSEVAALMRVSPTTVATHIARGLAQLREYLEVDNAD